MSLTEWSILGTIIFCFILVAVLGALWAMVGGAIDGISIAKSESKNKVIPDLDDSDIGLTGRLGMSESLNSNMLKPGDKQ